MMDDFDDIPSQPKGPPVRHPWEEYAIEKVRSQLIEDEVYLDDHVGAFGFYAVVGLLLAAGSVLEVLWSGQQPTPWKILFFIGSLLVFVGCLVLRFYGKMLARRVRQRQKWLDRHGVSLL